LLVACTSGKSDETIRLLIELGSNLNSTTIFDSSAFHLACLNGHDLVVKELLNHNIEMKENNKGFHPIHYAAVSKRGAFCLELLINMKINVNLRSNDGKTPLHIAALHQNFSCAQILIYNSWFCCEKLLFHMI
jgi:ankyrin repeat protein